jgi:hypothetical protein
VDKKKKKNKKKIKQQQQKEKVLKPMLEKNLCIEK